MLATVSAEPSTTETLVPELEYCDLVMKGGITSGVIYPAAAVELSRKFRFKNIGGTSAGAIAAAVVSAAELGRRQGFAGAFDVVERLSGELAKDGHLFKLFTPDKRTQGIFRVLLVAAANRSKSARVASTLGALFAAEWPVATAGWVVGMLLPSMLYAVARWGAGGFAQLPMMVVRHGTICLVCGLATGFALALAGSLWLGWKTAVKALAGNSFGMCSGMASEDGGDTLTGWIDAQIQAAANRTVDDAPVTFGDLWHAPKYTGEALSTERMVNLEVVTTGLTEGRPFTVPFLDGALYFDVGELEALFPKRVVDALVAATQRAYAEGQKLPVENRRHGLELPVSSPKDDAILLVRLPRNEDLPILLATRMSLSFPGLLSAIPMYRVDYKLQRNYDKSGTTWKTRVGTKVWFSDGGICSNFPLSFFDSPLPRWPTFGINLQAADSSVCGAGGNRPPENFVHMPKPNETAQTVWNSLGDRTWTAAGAVEQLGPLECVSRFAGAILNTMQNWRDNLQAGSPGYRDRIVSVSLCPDEGGLNLDMPQSLITTLSERGQLAGKDLCDFDFAQHMFTRYRISLCALEDYLREFERSIEEPAPQEAAGLEYIRGEKEPQSYKWGSKNVREKAAKAAEELCALSKHWTEELRAQEGFCAGAPRPKGELQSRPDF